MDGALELDEWSGGENGAPIECTVKGRFQGWAVKLVTGAPNGKGQIRIYRIEVFLKRAHTKRDLVHWFKSGHLFEDGGIEYSMYGRRLSRRLDQVHAISDVTKELLPHLEAICQLAERIDGGKCSYSFLLR